MPDANEEYLLYQMLLGAWSPDPYTAAEYAEFGTRIQAYMLKALHEAKIHTDWVNPDPPYDEAVQHYVGQILDAQTNGAFLDDFRAFQRRVSHFGLLNALAQTLLKIASPGVPDTYQGTEIWDFSLVDPDNRRPIDYRRRSRMLQQLQTSIVAAGENRKELAGLGEAAWQDTSVLLEGIDPHQGWRHLFTGEPITFGVQEYGPSLAIAEVLTDFPVALLVAGDKRGDAAWGSASFHTTMI